MLALFAGCSAQSSIPPVASPLPPVEVQTKAPKPDVRRHLTGIWWRAKGPRVQGLMLHDDGRLELLQVGALDGSSWRLEGRRVHLRMTDPANQDVYEDELFIRRLTDRTLLLEAADSYFSGTYKRKRKDVAPADLPMRPAPLPVSDHQLAESIELRSVAREAMPQREAWLARMDAIGDCEQVLNTNNCPRFYTDRHARLLLVEICQDEATFGPGIHLLNDLGSVASYPWFDPGFGRFICDHKCDTPEACYYRVTAAEENGRPTELVYDFDIGATFGEIRYRLGRDGDIRVIYRKIDEEPLEP